MKTIKKTLVIVAAFLAGIVLMPLAPLALAWDDKNLGLPC
jgi:hypothetical protein